MMMKKKLLLLLLGLGMAGGGWAQNAVLQTQAGSAQYAKQISRDSIYAYLSVLAHDSLEGRGTGDAGQKKAARYLKSKLMEFGVERVPGDSAYFQPFDLYSYDFGKVKVKAGDGEWELIRDFFTTSILSDTVISADEFVFLGYGMSTERYDNYGAEDYRGKIGVIYEGEPMVDGVYLSTGTTSPSAMADIRSKMRVAQNKGLAALMIVQPNYADNLSRIRRFVQSSRLHLQKPYGAALPDFRIAENVMERIFGKTEVAGAKKALLEGTENVDLRAEIPTELIFPGHIESIRTENVIGYVPGSETPEEYVIITAHYDHLGVSGEEIYYGADDNGSGTSMVLELARVFAQAHKEGKGPDRSVVFLFFTAEEKGLLGSEYYTDNPLLPLENTVTNLNIDMIGRTDEIYEAAGDDSPYVYLIGSDRISADLHEISEEMNSLHTELKLDYKYNDPNDPQRLYYRSDHYNFVRYGIPAIFYFRGLHVDYHKPTDTIDKVELDTVLQIGRLVFHTAWAVSDLGLGSE